jgi:hypothetical protein
MMGNTIIRAEGQATLQWCLIPALVNIALDFVFIKLLDLGIYSSNRHFLFHVFFFFILGTLYIKLS